MTDPVHRRPVGDRDELGQHRLGHRVDPVAIDGRFPVESQLDMIELHLSRQTAHRRGDLGHRDQRSHVEDFAPGQDQHRASFSSDLGQPDLPSVHSLPQASASVQNESCSSGLRS